MQRLIGVILVAGIVLPAWTPSMAVDDYQLRCQGTAGKQGRVFFKKAYGALADCRAGVNAGALPTDTDCALAPETADVIARAEAGVRQNLQKNCVDNRLDELDFGAECFGVTTVAALGDCLIETHLRSAETLAGLVYDQEGARKCSGGSSNGRSCADDLDCPNGSCVLQAEQRACTEALGAALGKLAHKRQAVLQSCTKLVAKGKLDEGTDCIETRLAKLERANARTAAAVAGACSDAVAATLAFSGRCAGRADADSVAACGICSANGESDGMLLVQTGQSPHGGLASLKRVTDAADCVGGPLSRCRAGDYLFANNRIRVVVQDLQRNLFGIGGFGGQIIDGDLARAAGQPDRDNFEEWAVSLNIENTAHYTSLTVLNDGRDGSPAVLRATGVDDLLDLVNGSTAVAAFGFPFPATADDVDLPVTILTDYILDPDANYVRVETTVQNIGSAPLQIFFGEYLNGSGQVELFQSGYGFGEPTVTTRCPVTSGFEDVCNFVAYSGEDDADGVSYGYVHSTPGSSVFTTVGVSVPQLGTEVVLALIGAATPPFAVAPLGEPGDSLSFTRYFVVGNGSVSSITDTRNEIQCLPTGRIEGRVKAGGQAAVRADIAVLGDPAVGPGLSPLTRNVLTHTRTDDAGRYSLTVPAGTYTVVAHFDDHPYEDGGSSPVEHEVTVEPFGRVKQDIALPATGAVRILVEDEGGQPIAAKASVVGFDPSVDPRNRQSVFGLINSTTGVFGDLFEDGLPFGVAKSIYVDQGGDSGVVPLEPGSYQVVVSHGPEYSTAAVDIEPSATLTQTVAARVERVVDTTGFVSGDFHVHSIDSADAEVSRVERVHTMLADGVDFFTPSEHDILVDFRPTIDALGATDLLGTATGQEITTFDYGHFNAWPLRIDPDQVNGGAVDHGGAAPAGLDFPSAGYFSEPPSVIIEQAHANAAGGRNTVQINHIHSHFGLDGNSGLAIDTGLKPPQSSVPPVARRLDPSVSNFFSDSFDALEIWIGDDRGQVLTNFLGQNIGDWFNLLNQGIVATGVADSDTHSTTTGPAGFPRSMVASPSDAPGELGALANVLSDNVNDGRVVGTNGPMVRVRVSAASTGETAALDLGFPTMLRTRNGAVDVSVEIESPTWAEFDTVEYYVNATTTRTTLTDRETGAGPIDLNRYKIAPNFVQRAGSDFAVSAAPVDGTSAKRLAATTTLNLTGLTEDAWLVVLVRGSDGVSKPLFPVVPASLRQSTNQTVEDLTDGNLGEDGVTALAFTNPIFIDVNGGGWSAPGLRIR